MTAAPLARVTGSALALASILALAPEARADDGPVDALGNMLRASPTITLVSTGVVVIADGTLTGLTVVDASNGRESPESVLLLESIVAVPQALGFGAAPSFFDITRWKPVENLGLLLPAQAWTGAMYVHGTWSLISQNLEPGPRLGVSYLIGVNYAFSATALGGLFQEKWAPFEVGIAEMGCSGVELAVTIERAVRDAPRRGGWAGLAAWSSVLFAHGLGSILVNNPDSRVSERDEDAATRSAARIAPYLTPIPDGGSVGVTGEF